MLSNVRSHQSPDSKDRELTSCLTDRLRGLASSSLPSRIVQSPLATPVATGQCHHRRSSMSVHNRYSDILSPVAEGLCATGPLPTSLKMSRKSVRTFLPKAANRQTDRQTIKQRRLHIILGGGNYANWCSCFKDEDSRMQRPWLISCCLYR